MKNKWFFSGLLGILLVFGLFMAGCSEVEDKDNGAGNNSSTTYTVTYNSNGASGSVPNAQTVEAGTNITVAGLGNLTFTGKTFSGWNTNATGTGTAYAAGSSLTVNANVTLYAQWVSGSSAEPITIILENNSPYGWQKTYEPNSLFNGTKIEKDQEYTFTYSFKSNASLDKLQVVFVENCAATNYAWNVISDYVVIEQDITANTVYSGSVTIIATGTALNTTPEANKLVFQTGPGTTSQPTLTFTSLSIVKGTGSGDANVIFNTVTANGSSSQTTTQLTLTFSQAITGLSANDITLSGVAGVTKGTLSGSGPNYTLPISGFTNGGTLNVAVNKIGFNISGSPKTVPIFYYNGNSGGGNNTVTFVSLDANGDFYTTNLTLTFDTAIPGLSVDDITIVPNNYSSIVVTKGDLISNGSVYTLYINTIDESNSGDFEVTPFNGSLTLEVNKQGYTINNSSQSTAINYFGGDTTAMLTSVVANGSASQTTTQLTLSFNKTIYGLSVEHITLSGISNINKVNINQPRLWEPVYTLDISGITNNENISVSVERPGYTISGTPKSVSVNYFNTNFSFIGVTANGSSVQTSTQLTLTFDKAVPGLAASDITLSGMSVTRGTLSGSGPTYTLGISGVSSNGILNVSVSKTGFVINGSPQTTSVYYYYVAPTTYTVTYNTNNGSGTVPTAQTVTIGSSVTLNNGSGLSRSGYTFGGWNTNSAGTGTNYNGGSSFTPTSNVTLYARWNAASANTYTVTYNINSGSGTTPTSQTVNAGSSVTLNNGSGLSRSGYTFGGWNTNSAGTGTNYNGGYSFTPTSNVTLYARWNAVPSASISVTVTGIPNSFVGNAGVLGLVIPGTNTTVIMDPRVIAASTTFSLTAPPVAYEVELALTAHTGAILTYRTFTRDISAGANTIPWSAFTLVQ